MTGAMLLAACQSAKVEPEKYTLEDDPAIQTIRKAVEHIERQNEVLVQVERGEKPTMAPPEKPSNPAFSRPVHLRNWSGPATEAVNEVAEVMGYSVALNGPVPAIEPLVDIDSNGESAYAVLNDIADQGERVYDVRVDVERKRITMAFRHKDGEG